jgi:anthranilate phosphoribosyltransferase
MSVVKVQEIVAGRKLTSGESRELMRAIVSGEMLPAQVAALLTALAIRGLTVDLLDGFAAAALDMAVPLDLGMSDLIDVCGTGGDGKSTFNVSTAVAFVLAGAGYHVAKHGNVAVSSSCGSSNVLQELGISLSANPEHLKRSLDTNKVCFIHAPLFHPAFKQVAQVRKELGFRTVFNALGPLINPARVRYRYSGVYSLELQRLYSYLLRNRGEKFAVVHSLDGYDEVSLTGVTRVVADSGAWDLKAEDIVGSSVPASATVAAAIGAPATLPESARVLERVLTSKGTQGEVGAIQRRVVVANAAVALWCYEGANDPLERYVALAEESIDSGRAYGALQGCRGV